MPKGGARPGAGRKKGYKEQGTLEKEAARELLRNMVKAKLGPMTEAQIANAMGLKYLVMRDKNGTFKPIKDGEATLAAGKGDEIIEVWEKFPNVQAFQDLLDRTLDKPKQSVDMTGEIAILGLEERIRAAQARLNGK